MIMVFFWNSEEHIFKWQKENIAFNSAFKGGCELLLIILRVDWKDLVRMFRKNI